MVVQKMMFEDDGEVGHIGGAAKLPPRCLRPVHVTFKAHDHMLPFTPE